VNLLRKKQLLLASLCALAAVTSSCHSAEEISPATKASATLRVLCAAIDSYHQEYGRYPQSIAELGPSDSEHCGPKAACLIDNVLASGNKSGRRYHYRVIAAKNQRQQETFVLTSDPLDAARATNRHFFTEGCSTVRYEDGKPATATSPVVDDSRR